jgi:hypothetical protein
MQATTVKGSLVLPRWAIAFRQLAAQFLQREFLGLVDAFPRDAELCANVFQDSLLPVF